MKKIIVTILIGLLVVSCLRANPSSAMFATITVDTSTSLQTIIGWEATAEAGHDYDCNTPLYPSYTSPTFGNYKTNLLNAMLDVGINRLRLEIFLSDVNATGYSANSQNAAIQPSTASAGQFHYDRIHRAMDTFVSDYRTLLAAQGESLYLTICVVDFKTAGYAAENTPSEYAFFVNKFITDFQSSYGYLPNAIEACLEPDSGNNPNWSASKLANNIVQANSTLVSNGFTGIRWIAPSVANGAIAKSWYDDMKTANSNVTALIDEVSYHRYTPPNTTELGQLRDDAEADGNSIAMLEHIGSGYTDLHTDLDTGRGTSWQQYTVTFPYPGVTDDGDQYFQCGCLTGTATPWSRTKLLRQYFKWVCRGAVRKAASTGNGSFAPLAFRNLPGNYTIIVKCSGSGTFTVAGLPDGTYHVTFTAADGSPYDQSLSDTVVSGGSDATATVSEAGVATLHADAPASAGGAGISGGAKLSGGAKISQ